MTASVLIVTDIFGNTPAIASLQRHLGLPCLIVSPFDEGFCVDNEQRAYQAFLAQGGVQAYANKLKQALIGRTGIQHVIAFSAGASAWWLAEAAQAKPVDSITLFYGSRIRDHLDIQTNANVHFVFAEHENAFKPAQLVKQLRERGYHAEIAIGSKHGFMNPYSAGFSLKTQTHYLGLLSEKLGTSIRKVA